MAKLLSKEEILRETVRTLLAGWGTSAVLMALDDVLKGDTRQEPSERKHSHESEPELPQALKLVEASSPLRNQDLLRRFAEDYDRGEALPKMTDVRRFLAAHHIHAPAVRSRNEAFRKMFPVIRGMSEKALLRIIHSTKFSGPAQLDEISDAIKGAGASIRRNG